MNTSTNNKNDTKKDEECLSIAIIGASYAGLTLANVIYNFNQQQQAQQQRQQSDDLNLKQIHITLFEKMGPPTSIGYVNGTLTLPSGESILDRIGQKGVWNDLRQTHSPPPNAFPNVHTTTLTNQYVSHNEHKQGNEENHDEFDSDPFTIPQHAFTETLRKNVKTQIQYRKRLVNIHLWNHRDAKLHMNPSSQNSPNPENVKNNKDGNDTHKYHYYLEMLCSDNNEAKQIKDNTRFVTVTIPSYTTVYRGPFHILVGADGVLSTCRKLQKETISFLPSIAPSSKQSFINATLPVCLIGDARWARDRWWDLGLLRIQSGADISLQDGLAMGELLVQHEFKIRQHFFGKSSQSSSLSSSFDSKLDKKDSWETKAWVPTDSFERFILDPNRKYINQTWIFIFTIFVFLLAILLGNEELSLFSS